MSDAPRRILEAAFCEALSAVRADTAVERAFDTHSTQAGDAFEAVPGTVHVLSLGKASVPMARAARARLGVAAGTALVVTKDGHAGGFSDWPVLETAHPVPDARCAEAGRRVLAFAADVPTDARLLLLLSGGTSALVSSPVEGIDLADLVRTNEVLLACGAPIDAVNAVRKRLTAVSGGRLAAVTRARRVDVWVVSDVLGDDLSSIASGPCAPDASDFASVNEGLRGRGVWDALPERVRNHLCEGERLMRRDVPSVSDPSFERVHTRIVASNSDALRAATDSLRRAGARVVVTSGRLEGEAGSRGVQLAALAAAVSTTQPIALVAGGETTVTLTAHAGRGGRNQELALAAAIRLDAEFGAARGASAAAVTLLAAGTDGSDGPTDAAGAIVDAGSVARMRAAGFAARAALANHDAMPALEAAGDLLRTGPTGSNVMDLTLAWIDPPMQ